ncbi:beta-hydroxylase [Azotobacter vinelandii]|nr:beta-hydroxylase [Azotobacter vinelandii]
MGLLLFPDIILSAVKYLILAVLVFSVGYVHLRGRVRHKLTRQITDHSSFLAPLNTLLYLTSSVPNRPYLSPDEFPEMKRFQDNWESIREEALALFQAGEIKRSDTYNDAGFNSFFKSGWKRFYLKWYGDSHPSASKLCPKTTALLQEVGSVKAAMFTLMPAHSKLVRHRDPYAGSLRYHLGLSTPNDPGCFISVDGQTYAWRDGEAVVFDETYIHHVENTTDKDRLIFFCDMERPLKYGWATALNRWFSRTVMAAASSPNDAGDKTGGVNQAFKYLYWLRLQGKALKKRSRNLYYTLKWGVLGGLFGLFLLS